MLSIIPFKSPKPLRFLSLGSPHFQTSSQALQLGLGFCLSLRTMSATETAAAAATGTVIEKRKPVFTKVDQLKPVTSGHTLTVKVVSSTPVSQKGRSASQPLRQTRIAECLVGDETGSVLFTARNDQVDIMKSGATVILRNAKIDMFKGSMRLAVDKWGRVELTEPANFVVKEDNNLSLVEYELVNVTEE